MRRSAVALLLAVTLLLGSLTFVAEKPARASPVVVTVTKIYLDVSGLSYYFVPNWLPNLPNGTPIQVNFTDADTAGVAHTFTILGREGIALPTTAGAGELIKVAYNRTYPALVNVNATNTPSAAGTYYGNFTSPATPGWYQFVCTEGGHFQEGMYGYISFGENIPANLSVTSPPTGPGLAVFLIVGTIVALTVVAIVLGFVIGRRHGDRFEMPPERLGYPEPPGGEDDAPRPLPPSPPHG